jgi:hypothetical protein
VTARQVIHQAVALMEEQGPRRRENRHRDRVVGRLRSAPFYVEDAFRVGRGREFGDRRPEGSGCPPEGNDSPPEGSGSPSEGSDCPPGGNDRPPEGSDRPLEGNDCPPEGSDCPLEGNGCPPEWNGRPLDGDDGIPGGGRLPDAVLHKNVSLIDTESVLVL